MYFSRKACLENDFHSLRLSPYIILVNIEDSCSASDFDCDDFVQLIRLEEAIDTVSIVGKGVDVVMVQPTN